MHTRPVRYLGGPLDGTTADTTGWTDDEVRNGTYQIIDGWTLRASYEPAPDGDPYLWHYQGPVDA